MRSSMELAQHYALGTINLEQLIEALPLDADLPIILGYAELYGQRFDRWCRQRTERQQQMEADWKQWQQEYFASADAILDSEDEWSYQEYMEQIELAFEVFEKRSQYSEADLQAAYDAWYLSVSDRRGQIIRIARGAVQKNVHLETIYKFFRTYKLSQSEITVFWLEYNRDKFIK